MRLVGKQKLQQYSLKILKVCKKPISFEVFEDSSKAMLKQAYEINSGVKMFMLKFQSLIQKESLLDQ